MMVFPKNDGWDPRPCTWKIVLLGKRQRKSASFTCPNGHTYLLSGYSVLPNGSVHPMVLCPADNCGFHELIKLEGWEPEGVTAA